MDENTLLSMVRCVRGGPGREACRGTLAPDGDQWLCQSCGFRYPVVRGVPVLRDEPESIASSWFDRVYLGRSRDKDLASDYLARERRFMTEFARERGLRGPCLEVGCGTGIFAETVPGHLGLEYSLESLFATGFESFDRVCGDARRLPLADAAMECVFTFCVLEHVAELDVAFSEIDRVLRPGGWLVLRPAWHCTRYTTELVPVRSYRQLSARWKLIKALLPVIRSRPYKLATWTPWRLWRRLAQRPNNPLSWKRLTPYYGDEWIADADAASGIDCHEGILYYTSRGYACHSHPTAIRQLLAGHDIVVLQKEGAANAGERTVRGSSERTAKGARTSASMTAKSSVGAR